MSVIDSLNNRRFIAQSSRTAPESANAVEVPQLPAPANLVYLNRLTYQPAQWRWRRPLAAGIQNNGETAALKRAKSDIGSMSRNDGTNSVWYWSLSAEIVPEVVE